MSAAPPAWLIPALLVLVALILAALLVLLWRRRAGPANSAVAAPPAAAPQLDKQGFADAIATLYPPVAQLGKYGQPCVLVCGDAGAGKAAVLAAAGLKPIGGGAAGPSGWWSSMDGAAFELPDAAWLDEGQAWRDVVHLLDRHRGLRPLDALVWVVPLALLCGSAAERAAGAARLSAKLVELRVMLGLQLPVYAIISGCGRVAGFGQLAAALEVTQTAQPGPDLLQQSLGCSNPNGIGTAFSKGWVEQGVTALCTRLRAIVAEIGLQGHATGSFDALYLLPAAIADAIAPLPELLDQAMRRNATLAPVDLRGFYLSGHVAAAAPAATEPPDEYEVLPAPAPAPTAAAFCAELFTTRIFGEFGLASIARRPIGSEHGIRRYVMWGGVVLALVWLVLLWPAYLNAEPQAQAMRAPLTRMRLALAAHPPGAHQPDQQPNQSDTVATLAEIDRVPDWTLSSPLIPLSWSWTAGVDAQLVQVVHRYYQQVVLADIFEALNMRGAAIAAGKDSEPGGASVPATQTTLPEFNDINRFVDATLLFEANRLRFDLLASEGVGSWADASALLQYLFKLPLTPRSRDSTRRFDEMISRSHLQLPPSAAAQDEQKDFPDRLKKLHQAWLARLFDENQIADLSSTVAVKLAGMEPQDSRSGLAIAGLDATLTALDAALAASRLAWADGKPNLGAQYDQLKTKIGQSTLLRAQIGKLNDDTVEAQAHLRKAISPLTSGPQAVLAFDKDNRLGLSAEAAALMAALDQMKRYPFMQALPADDGVVGADALVQWDVARLDDADAVRKDFQAYEGDAAIKAPPRFAAALNNFARLRAAAHVADALGHAAAGLAPQQDWRASNFALAAQRLPVLIAALRKLGQPGRAAQWQAMMDDQAARLLKLLQGQLYARPLYLPDAATVAAWNGTRLGALPAYGAFAATDMHDYLAAQVDEVRALADAAKAPREWLEASASGKTGAASALLAAWRKLDAEMVKYATKDPSGSVAQLEQLLTVDLNGIDSANCSDKLVRLQRTRQADYFQRQGQLAAGMYLRRCTELQTDGARSAYRTIATHYNTALLDNYPFAASIAAPDAAPGQVRYMLRLLDAHYDEVHGWLALQQGEGASNALAFLERLAAGRALLGAMLQLGPDGAPAALDLWPQFRVNRARESGADQIIAWDVDAGAAAAVPGGALAWRLGEPVAFSLRWANNSAREPAADPGRYPDLQVAAKQASWRYAGPWALLKAMSSHAAGPADTGADTLLPQVLRFAVPTQYSDGKPTADTVAFGRLGVTLHGKPERLALPAFPHTRAPALVPATKPAAPTAASL